MMCSSHGWASHAALHESAHAVVAIKRGIKFDRISVAPPRAILSALASGQAIAGGLHLAESAVLLARHREADFLDMLVAGSLVEAAALGHGLRSSELGDKALWIASRTVGGDAPTDEDLWDAARTRMGLALEGMYPAVKAVADVLVSPLSVDGDGSYTGFDDELVLTEDEIRAAIGSA